MEYGHSANFQTRGDEVAIFGWVEFASREARDLANQKVAADPRMTDLMESLGAGFDASRMTYGGFRKFVLSSRKGIGPANKKHDDC